MAMILHAFVSSYVTKLANMVDEKLVLILGVKEDIKKLQRRLETMRCVLEDAERKRIKSTVINSWLTELKDVMYDADDLMDLFGQFEGIKLFEDQKLVRCLSTMFSCFHSLGLRYDIGNRVRKINARIDIICKDRLMFSLESSDPDIQVGRANPRKTSSILELDVVGTDIEEGTRSLAELLLKENGLMCCVVAIVGMGGIGKTTLAQKVFNYQQICDYFPTRVWLCVSQNFVETDLLKEMIRWVGGDYGRAETKAELQPILSALVSGKALFLVLDDVWGADVWVDLLRNTLQSVAGICKVLVTTRDENVAKKMGIMHIHHVNQLPTNFGWELLCKKLHVEGVDEEIQTLNNIGVQIVEKCHGLPLAIKAIAGVLITKERSRTAWERVLKRDTWSISQLPEELRGALYLSYEDLPSHLKQCFLYCALFPEDFKFSREDLVRLWVSEGFVVVEENMLAEEVAEDYYEELIRRSLLQPYPGHYDERRCLIHDLLRSLAQVLACDESLFGDVNLVHYESSLKLRRLALTNCAEVATLPHSLRDQIYLRSLLLHRNRGIKTVDKDLFRRLKHLRVLDLCGTDIESLPSSIGNLIHLRLLDIDRTKVRNLPESIKCLLNLQTLNLAGCKFLLALPRGIIRLGNLRRLGIAGTSLSHLPAGIGGLQHLNHIEGFVVASVDNEANEESFCRLEELHSLSELRFLRIERLERATRGVSLLTNKPLLKELMLCCTVQNTRNYELPISVDEIQRIEKVFEDLLPPPSLEHLSIKGFFGQKHPIWMSSLSTIVPSLAYIRLCNCRSMRQLPPLGQLCQLKYICISGVSAVVIIGLEFLCFDSCRTTLFPSLERLKIKQMASWEEWLLSKPGEESSIRPFPRLKQLDLIGCPKLKALPEGLQHATALRRLHIEGAHGIQEIVNLPALVEWLDVKNNSTIKRISNLPALRKLIVWDCPALKHLDKLNSLRRLELMDCLTESLPEWLLGQLRYQKDLMFHMTCKVELLNRCLIGCPEWPIIQQLPQVYACSEDTKAFLFYTKEPFTFKTNLIT